MAQDDGFLSRWSRRKAQQAGGQALPLEAEAEARAPAVPRPATPQRAEQPLAVPGRASAAAAPAPPAEPAEPAPPPPTLEEARQLTPDADFTRFVGRDVDPQVKNAALKNLFSAPQFNVMDGLDIYIDDYGKPDPLPAGMLERMTQSAFLGLFRPSPEEQAAALAAQGAPPALDPPAGAALPEPVTAPTAPTTPPAPTDSQDPAFHEDPDLRLQRHDDAGRAGPGQGAEPDSGGQR